MAKARSKAEQVSALFKILADKNRSGVLMMLAQSSRKGIPVGDLAEELDMSQSAMSHLLAGLYGEDVVAPKRDGRIVHYMLANSPIAKKLVKLLKMAQG